MLKIIKSVSLVFYAIRIRREFLIIPCSLLTLFFIFEFFPAQKVHAGCTSSNDYFTTRGGENCINYSDGSYGVTCSGPGNMYKDKPGGNDCEWWDPGSFDYGYCCHTFVCTGSCNSGGPVPCTKVDGEWGDWGKCDESCGGGTQTRKCNDPKPECGGSECSGNSSQACNTTPCCEVNKTYNLNVKVNEVSGPTTNLSCPGSVAPKGVKVSVNSSVSPFTAVSGSPKSISEGKASFNDISVNSFGKNLVFSASGAATFGEIIEVYEQACPAVGLYSLNNLNVKPCDTKEVTLGVNKKVKIGWTSVIDTNIFAQSMDVSAPLGTGSQPGGFEKVLINSKDNQTGGYVFSMEGTSTPDNHFYESGRGGKALNLSDKSTSKWLNNFSFNPPNHSEVIEITSSSFPSFTANKVYKISASRLNSILSDNVTYQISDGESIVVLYVIPSEGVDKITFNGSLTTNSLGRLIIVSPLSIEISKDIGTQASSYNINQNPNIMASIISAQEITFKTIKDSDPSSTDIPIMVTAPLISRTNISLNRDLGHDLNATLPAQSVLAHNKYLYLLSSLERSKAHDFLHYTGLTTYSLEWEYIY